MEQPLEKKLVINNKNYVRDMCFKGYGIELHPITPWDLLNLRRWRNSPRINQQMIDTSYITPRQQRLWYEKIKERDDQAYWVVWCKGVRTGCMYITGEGTLELQKEQLTGGLYTGDSVVKHGLLGYAMLMMQLDIAFEYLSVSEFWGPIKKHNTRVIAWNKKLGYTIYNEDSQFVYIRINKNKYKQNKLIFDRYFKKCNFLEIINN